MSPDRGTLTYKPKPKHYEPLFVDLRFVPEFTSKRFTYVGPNPARLTNLFVILLDKTTLFVNLVVDTFNSIL